MDESDSPGKSLIVFCLIKNIPYYCLSGFLKRGKGKCMCLILHFYSEMGEGRAYHWHIHKGDYGNVSSSLASHTF